MTTAFADDRRTFMTAAGMGVLGALVLPTARGAEAAPTDAEAANIAFVNRFCAAWATRDIPQLLEFLTADCVYRMTETTPPATGHPEIAARIKTFVDSSDAIDFLVLESYAKGPMVINHRIDRFSSTTRPFTWEGVGVFFLKDGRIREWFDYTIRMER